MVRPQAINFALIEDLGRRVGTSDLFSWIEERATILARLGWKRPGFVELGERLFAEVGISACVRDRTLTDTARLQPIGDGTYVIRHHSFSRREDQRFWIAHELAHTFWLDHGGKGQAVSSLQRISGADPTIELLCNRLAAALLVPKGLLQTMLSDEGYRLDDTPPPIHLICTFARKLRVPPRLLARRWFHDILNVPLNVVCLEPYSPAATKFKDKQFRIAWEAVFYSATKLSKKLQGRLVPSTAIENADPDETRTCPIDGRWLELIQQARNIDSHSTAFFRLSKKPAIKGFVTRTQRRVTLAFFH
jgi:hypothetical protein